MELDAATVAKTKSGKTRGPRSEWAHSQVFSSEDEEEATGHGRQSRASLWGDEPGKSTRSPKSHAPTKKVTSASHDKPSSLL